MRRVENIRSPLQVAESQPPTEQTAHDLAAIRRTLKLAEEELKRERDRIARNIDLSS